MEECGMYISSRAFIKAVGDIFYMVNLMST